MRIPNKLVLAFLCSMLAACQTLDQAQFTAPSDRLALLTERVRMIAVSHGMANCVPETVVVGATACFKTGDTSYTFVGVRLAGSLAVVDLSYRSAGLGGELFAKLESELNADFKKTFGEGAVKPSERGSFVSIVHKAA